MKADMLKEIKQLYKALEDMNIHLIDGEKEVIEEMVNGAMDRIEWGDAKYN